jgi:hypothetical protein
MRLIACALLFAALCLPVLAADSAAGRWDGSIALPNMKLEIHVHLEQSGEAWKGDIDIPAQGARDLPLTAITVDGAKVSFQIAGVPGTPTFNGTPATSSMATSRRAAARSRSRSPAGRRTIRRRSSPGWTTSSTAR